MSPVKEHTTVRLDPGQRRRLDRLAEAGGVDASEAMRRVLEQGLEAAGEPVERPAQFGRWCIADYKRFASGLELPDGSPFVLEGHLLLILRELFATGRVELLVLVPKGNFKTTLMASLAVFHVLTVRNANVYIGASDAGQAAEMYRFAAHFAESDERSAERLLVRRSTREIRSLVDQGFIKVLASDDSRIGGKRQVFNPTLALIDELQGHENDNLYVDLRSGVFKRDGVMATITTAGSDDESVLGQLRRRFLEIESEGGTVERGLRVDRSGRVRPHDDGRLTIARSKSGRTAMLEWACRATDDLADMATVKLANPASGVTLASLEDAHEAPGITPAQFARYRANVWAQADDAVIAQEAWDALDTGATVPPDATVWLTVDYARKSDTSAVVQLWRRDDGVVVPEAHVWALAGRDAGRVRQAAHHLIRGERTIRQSLVRDHIRRVRDDGRFVEGVLYDPHLFDPEELADEGFAMVEFPQTPARTCPASKALYEAVHQGGIEHDGDPVLRSHVVHAGAKLVGEEWRFSKAASKRPIDALICMMMGLGSASQALATGGFEW